MNDDLQVDVQGLDDILTAFNYLNNLLDKREVRKGLRDASRMLVKQGKQNLKSKLKGKSTYLLSSTSYRIKRKNTGALIGWKLPIKIQQKNSTRLSGAAWWIDRGTVERKTSKGYNRGHVTGTKFWSDVANNDVDRAMNMVARAIQSAMVKI